MLSFKKFLNEYFYLSLNESDSETASNNTKGVLHELLTGYHLNNGKHMEKHKNSNGESPNEAHDRLKATIHPNEYKRISDKAKSAAEDIKKNLPAGHAIHAVHWTSKPGDIHRSTGVHATQKQDSSDLIVHTKAKDSNAMKYHGVSLKVSDNASKNLPSSNLGSVYSGSKAKEFLAQHKKDILKDHPHLAGKNAKTRKAELKSNPDLKADIKKRNTTLLHTLAKHHGDELQQKLDNGQHKEVVEHIRKVLHAHETPLQNAGHNFIKHTTYETAKGVQHHISNPGKDHEHILNDPKNITVKSNGSVVSYYHKGKKFAAQAHKFATQSDPLASIRSSGIST